MILKKIHFAIDKTTKANASQKILLKRYKNYSPQQSDIIAVIGGDGFMLETLKKYRKYNNSNRWRWIYATNSKKN